MTKSAVAFTGGKLNLKGDKKRPAKKKTKNSKCGGESSEGEKATAKSSAASSRSDRHGSDDHDDDGYRDSGKKDPRGGDGSDDEDLTPAEKRSRKFKRQRERKEMEQVVRWVPFWPVCVRSITFVTVFSACLFPHHHELTFIIIFVLARFFCRSLARQHEPPRARGTIQRKAREVDGVERYSAC
jgi:hypothetical protein